MQHQEVHRLGSHARYFNLNGHWKNTDTHDNILWGQKNCIQSYKFWRSGKFPGEYLLKKTIGSFAMWLRCNLGRSKMKIAFYFRLVWPILGELSKSKFFWHAHVAKLDEITGKTRVRYSELGEITGKNRVLPCGLQKPQRLIFYWKMSIGGLNYTFWKRTSVFEPPELPFLGKNEPLWLTYMWMAMYKCKFRKLGTTTTLHTIIPRLSKIREKTLLPRYI